jgi:hypothetical protein
MNDTTGAKLVYLPLFGSWLGIAMKVVTADKQMHIGLSGSPTSDLSTDCESIITFQQPMKNPNRITVHFQRNRKNASLPMPRMAAGRLGESKSFGFSLQDCDKSSDGKQQFLNLVFLSQEKPAGFDALYVKIELPKEKGFARPIYLRIMLTKRVSNNMNGFLVRAEEVTENLVPNHLREALLSTETQPAQS